MAADRTAYRAGVAGRTRVSCSRSASRARCRRDFTEETGTPRISAVSSVDSSSMSCSQGARAMVQ